MSKVGEVEVKLKLDSKQFQKDLMELWKQLYLANASLTGPKSGAASSKATPQGSVAGAWASLSTLPMPAGLSSGTAGSATSSTTDGYWWGYLRTQYLYNAKFHLFKGNNTMCGLRKSSWPSSSIPEPVRQCKKCQAKFLALVTEEYVDEG